PRVRGGRSARRGRAGRSAHPLAPAAGTLEVAPMSQLRMLIDVALAMVLGSVIGLEREFARKAAALRTHMLVAGAAAMLVEGARGLLDQFVLPGTSSLVRFDPIPVITAVVTAVGFLGAGTLIRLVDLEHVE